MNTPLISPIAEMADTATLSPTDYEVLTELVADASGLVDTNAVKDDLTVGETEAFPFELAERLLNGDHPITVFREYRGITVHRLEQIPINLVRNRRQ